MFDFFQRRRRDRDTLAAVRDVTSRIGRGVHKRIDENRELLELMQARCPDFLISHPWVEGWLASHDDFFTHLAITASIENPRNRTREIAGHRFPRPWPGRPAAIHEAMPEGTA
jgi:hypothetical protein